MARDQEKAKIAKKRWRDEHKDYPKEYYKKWIVKNREKRNIARNEWKRNNREKVNLAQRILRGKNLEIARAKEREAYKRNKDKIIIMKRAREKKAIENLSDSYVKRKICFGSSIRVSDLNNTCYKPLIEAYRENIKLKRLIKSLSTTKEVTNGQH